RALYNTMNERLHEARQVAELESDGINLIEPALVPAASSGIKPPMIVAAAGIGSLFFGLTFVAGLSLIDRRIIHPDQILALGFDRIVSAPKVDQPTTVSPLKSQGQKVKREQYQAQLLFDEAIRRILSQSVFDGFGQKRVVLVTSGSKQEGKTTVARRLASFAAASGCSAVLVEADLRRPGNYSHKLGESNGGLARFLEAGEGSNLENVLVCDRRTGMHVIPTTDTVQHSTELLASPAMSQLLETLSERYDVVVIDTPPVGLTPDPEVLLKYADDIVFVVKHRASLIDRTKRATEFLKRAGDRKTIMMVNMTDMAFFDDYYGAGDHVYEFSSRKRWSRKAATSLLKNRLYRVRPRSAQHSDNTVQTYEVQKPSQH
ncbi:MAG: AAA family ATPase, partial [Pseudomonadota bacterium]